MVRLWSLGALFWYRGSFSVVLMGCLLFAVPLASCFSLVWNLFVVFWLSCAGVSVALLESLFFESVFGHWVLCFVTAGLFRWF